MKVFRIVFRGEEHPHYTITQAFKSRFEQVDTLYWDEIEIPYLNEVIKGRVREHKYDAVFMQIQTPGVIYPDTAKTIAENSIGFNWTGDVRENLRAYTEIGEHLITLFTNQTDVKKMKGLGFRSDFLQVGYDHKFYFDQKLERKPKVVFCANYYPEMDFPLTDYRIEAVRELKKFSDQFSLYGLKWDKLSIEADIKKVENFQEAMIYNSSLLAVSISHFNYSHYFSDRLLREMACGCCVLSHRYQDCESDFEDGKNIVFFDNIPELSEKVAYYLRHPEEAQKIGSEASEFVKKYMWSNVVERFKNLVIKYQ